MKNELQLLENIFSDFVKFDELVKESFEQYQYEAFRKVQNMVAEECTRIKNTLNDQTQGMHEQNHIKLFVSQYLIRLSNLLNRITTYKGMYEISWDRKHKELQAQTEYKEEEKLFSIELHQFTGINLCENEIRILTLNLVRDYEYLFDNLEKDDAISIIINDFKKNPPLQNGLPMQQKIQWTKSPKEFVKLFHPLIKNGTLKYKGESDVEPIVKMLYSIIEMDKKRGSGTLEIDSLLTYFKKENTGDTY